MRRVVEILDGRNGVGLERTVEDEEPGKLESRFNLFPGNRVDLDHTTYTVSRRLRSKFQPKNAHLFFPHRIGKLVAQRQDSTTSLSVPLVRLFILVRNGAEHALERLGSSLDGE